MLSRAKYTLVMAYTKTEWKARQGVNLNKFTKSRETEESVILTNTPDSITQPGTPFTADNMNKIEQGIADAHTTADRAVERLQSEVNRATDAEEALGRNKQNNLNRTVVGNDNSTAASVTDTGSNLSVPTPVTINAPAASDTQLTAGKKTLRNAVQTIANNIAALFNHAKNKDNPHQVTQAQLGLGNLFNENSSLTVTADNNTNVTADTAAKTGTLIAHFNWLRQKINGILGSSGLGSKAPLASPALTGTPTAPTQAANSFNTYIATTNYVDRKIQSTLYDPGEYSSLPTGNILVVYQ